MITSPLTPERRTVYWTVAAYDTHGRSVYRSTGLLSVAPARYWREFWASRRETARMELTEHSLVVAHTLIGFEDLPGKGEPTLLPELPAGAHEVKRFFRFSRALEDGSLTGFGPTVLRTGDDVRHFYEWTVKNSATSTGTPGCMATSPRTRLTSATAAAEHRRDPGTVSRAMRWAGRLVSQRSARRWGKVAPGVSTPI
ncbi:hypothetical protein ACQEV2_42190 [Streptomyces sp. CA-251387]|uniref:hypothetical protein n=1 Tax=Streptomyces sp. CA-251387 TaxID=3240064 RepID=UPI003D8A1D8D